MRLDDREIVRKFAENGPYMDGCGGCLSCWEDMSDYNNPEKHKADCLWRLAVEREGEFHAAE